MTDTQAKADDLVIELRRHEKDYPSLIHGPLCGQSADEIERLRAQLAAAEARVQKFHDALKKHSERPTADGIAAAIRETEYKYFGDYEFSDSQWDAVITLVSAGRHFIAAEAQLATAQKALEIANDLLDEARSGYVGGSAPDEQWDRLREDWRKDYRNSLHPNGEENA